jgi:hypothetical protein
MLYAINYDLKIPGRNYVGLENAIKDCGSWWHYLGSTWLLDAHLSAAQISARLRPHIDDNDRLLVIGLTNDYSGWLPKDAWTWIQQRLPRAA